jgi:phosphoribosylformylglycinamidine (FGAM) synthase-like enzyme
MNKDMFKKFYHFCLTLFKKTMSTTENSFPVGGMLASVWGQSEEQANAFNITVAVEEIQSGLEDLFRARKTEVVASIQAVNKAIKDARNVTSDNKGQRAVAIDNALRNQRIAVEAEYSALETYVVATGALPSSKPRTPDLQPSHERDMYREWWTTENVLQVPERLKQYIKK